MIDNLTNNPRKMVKENFGHLLEQPTTFKGTILSVPLLCKDLPYDQEIKE